MKFRDYITEGRPKKPRYKCIECGKMKKRDEFRANFICKDCFPKFWDKKRKREYNKMISPFS